MQRLRTDLEQTLSLKSSQAEELEKLNTELNVISSISYVCEFETIFSR